MPKYHIWTIGCQMNKAESERLGSRLEEMGYQPVATADKADLVIVNSCVVRQSAENRASNKLNALKQLKRANHQLNIALTGCLVNSEVDHLRRCFPHVDCFFKPGDCPQWLENENKMRASLPRHPSSSTFIPGA